MVTCVACGRQFIDDYELHRGCSDEARRECLKMYVNSLDGLQRALDVQRILPNGARPDWGLGRRMTPAMALGLCTRPLSTQEILCMRGVQSVSS
jgi:hypothetical protein